MSGMMGNPLCVEHNEDGQDNRMGRIDRIEDKTKKMRFDRG
jgi:hypothetical protein